MRSPLAFRNFPAVPAITLGLALACAASWDLSAAGTFSGDYVITDPTHPPGQYFASTTLGNWTATILDSGLPNPAFVDTGFAPDSVTLSATSAFTTPDFHGPAPLGLGFNQVSAEIRTTATQTGTFSMDYSVKIGNDLLAFDNEGIYPLTGNGTVVLSVVPGEQFGFRATSESAFPALSARAGKAGPGLAGFGAQVVTLTNPSFTTVPESSTVWAGLAVIGSGFWGWRRSRNTSGQRPA